MLNSEDFSCTLDWLMEQSAIRRTRSWHGPENVIEAAAECLGWLVRDMLPPSQAAWSLVMAAARADRDDDVVRQQVIPLMGLRSDVGLLRAETVRVIRDGLLLIEGQDAPRFWYTAQALGIAFRLFNMNWEDGDRLSSTPAEDRQ